MLCSISNGTNTHATTWVKVNRTWRSELALAPRHYYAHIKPSMEQGWVKFDDDTVTPCSEYAAVEDNYGGQS